MLTAHPSTPAADRRAGATVALALLVLTALRLAVLFSTPLELYPDEAQYWLWAQHPAFGYFSKPPMIAWLIAATTAVGGDAEPWVRLSAPLLQGATAYILFRAARRLAGPGAGVWTATVYSLMPGVQLSSGVIATDAPLLFFLAVALWIYAALWTKPGEAPAGAGGALGLGLALGLACLSKYAAVYGVAGLALHAALDRRARRLWSGPALACAGIGLLAMLAPNLAWNLSHGLATLRHTVSDANLGGDGRRAGWLHPRGALGFIAGQFAVFGPVPFALLLASAAAGARRALRRGAAPDPASGGPERLLLALAAPALLVVLGEALAARANANWAASAYVPGSALVGLVLARGWKSGAARWPALVTVGLQGGLALLFLGLALRPGLADGLGLGNGLKRARGWQALAQGIEREVVVARATGPVTAVAVDDRFVFNALAYYGRDFWRRPDAPPLRMWVRYGRPLNQAEAEAPLAAGSAGGRVLFANLIEDYRRETRADFRAVSSERAMQTPLDARRVRRLSLFVGEGFRPGPRDAGGRPLSGRAW